MSRHRPPPELINFLQPYDPAVQNLALKLRGLVLEEMTPCYENIYDAYSAVAIGYGWSDRLKDGVFHIAVYTNHVNLGFNHGVALKDPLKILEGKGNRIRHIGIRNEDDLKRPALRSYIRGAIQVAREDAHKLGEPISTPALKPGQVISCVKAIYAKKRRPRQITRK